MTKMMWQDWEPHYGMDRDSYAIPTPQANAAELNNKKRELEQAKQKVERLESEIKDMEAAMQQPMGSVGGLANLRRCTARQLESMLHRTGGKVEDCVNLECWDGKLHSNRARADDILAELHKCKKLKYINVWDDNSIRSFEWLSRCASLACLTIDMGGSARKIPADSDFLPKGRGKGRAGKWRNDLLRMGCYCTVEFLRPLVNLRFLYLAVWANNECTVCDNISPLQCLVNLEELEVRAVYVHHLDDIKNCLKLTRFWFHTHKEIDNIAGLRNLTELQDVKLWAEKTCSFDLSPLRELAKLKMLHVPNRQQWATSSIRKHLYENSVEISWGSQHKGTKRKVMQ